MITIRKKTPSKSWKLIRQKSTGNILTDDHCLYQQDPAYIKKLIIEAHDAIANGGTAPNHKFGAYYYSFTGTFEDYEQLDHIPVMRGEFEFDSIHNGTSSIQIYFKSRAGGKYTLKGNDANNFFQKVGQGKIRMSGDGFYEFNFTFTKSSTKVFMILEPDNAHI